MAIVNNTLDNLIAFVLILLTLSLVVQAIQGFVKKIFKLKSRQITKSLNQLFQDAVGSESNGYAQRATDLFNSTIQTFKELGRYTAWNKPVLDSISKGDLFHVVG